MRIAVWLKTEYKRAWVCLPSLILKAVILAIAVSMTAFCAYRIWMHNQTETVRIGYSAPQDELTQLALTYIENMESLQGWCSLIPISEEEGIEAVDRGELAALIVLPGQVVEGIMDGTNEPARLYISGYSQALGYVFEELANAGVGMLAVAQAEIYATDDMMSAAGIDRQVIEEQYQQLDLHNLNVVMNRDRIFKRSSVSATGTVGAIVYYAGAFLTLIMSVAGLFFGGYFRRTELEERITCCRLGVPYVVQALGRGCVSACLTALLLIIPFGLLLVADCRSWFQVPQITIRSILIFLLLLLCAGAYTQFLYSYTGKAGTSGMVISMLALIQGYVSGCFLPTAILPQVVKKISFIFPATYIKAGFTIILTGRKQQFGQACAGLVFWTVFFTLVGSVLIGRKERQAIAGTDHTGGLSGNSLSAIMFRRLLQRKSFWYCLCLTTLLSCIMIDLEHHSDTTLHAVYYTQNKEIDQLLTSYGGLVEFEAAASEEEMLHQIMTGKAECGYIIPDDIGSKMQWADADKSIQVLEGEDALFTGVVNEVLFQQLFSHTSYAWYADYMGKLGVYENAQEAIAKRMQDGSTFTFERQVLQPTDQDQGGQVTYPVWIITVIQVVLCGLLGAIQSYSDYTKHYYYKKSYVITTALLIVQPMVFAAMAGILTIVFYNSY